MTVISKWHIHAVENQEYGSAVVKARPVGPKMVDGKPEFENPEDERFWTASPMGMMEITINNPPAAEQFQPGDDFLVTFERVPKVEKE